MKKSNKELYDDGIEKELHQIADNIRQIRIDRELSVEKYAELVHISDSLARQIETGSRKVTMESFLKVMMGLHVSADMLISTNSNDKYNEKYVKEFLEIIDGFSEKEVHYIFKVVRTVMSR